MNILQILDDELKNTNWSQEQKLRYIYIRSCQIFSYDSKYNFLESKKEKEHIGNKKIDLENLTDNIVICTSYAREVLPKLINEILGIDCNETGNAHRWNISQIGERIMLLDATASWDLQRVKMGLTTYGYRPMTKEYNFQKKLKEIDKDIGYIAEDYKNKIIETRNSKLFEEYLKYSELEQADKYSYEYLVYKIYTIKEIYDKYTTLQAFSDCEFCISYLIKKLLEEDIKEFLPVFLYDDIKENWEFINVYPFNLNGEMIYFVLKKENDRFCFYETTQNDALTYVKTLKGENKEFVLKR